MKKIYLIMGILLTSGVFAGEREGGGGIVISAEFAKTGRYAIELLGKGDISIDVNSIMSAIKETKVIPVDEICYTEPVLGKKYCEDAHYDEKNNMILFVYKNWDKMVCQDKLLLSTHELLRASGLETEDYKYSGRFIGNDIVQCTDTSSQGQKKCADLDVRISALILDFCNDLNVLSARRKQH